MNLNNANGPASQPDDPGSVLIGRPTVAANTAAGLSRKEFRAFTEADLSVAEWVRLPSPRARCRLTGLSRTGLNEAIERGEIRAITVRQPGAVRGVKLINKASLVAWLRRLDQEQNRMVGAGMGAQPTAVGQPGGSL